MTSLTKAGIAFVLLALFASVALIQQYAAQSHQYGPEVDPAPALPGVPGELPRLVNLKTDNCIHCKRMIPILAELEQDYSQDLAVFTFDVGLRPEIGRSFGTVRILPTLVFMDQTGREVYRFEGYMTKAEILQRFRSLGLLG